MAEAEGRQHPRAQARIKVEYHFGSSTGVGYTNDISEGGIYLASSPIAPIGTRIYLRMHLPGSHAGEPLKIIGLGTRAIDSAEGKIKPGMGIHFEVAYARTRESLGDFIDSLLAIGQDPRAVLGRDMVKADASGDGDTRFSLSFPASDDQPASKPLDAGELKQAFAFKAPAAEVDWRRIRKIALWVLLALVVGGVIVVFIRLIGGLATPG